MIVKDSSGKQYRLPTISTSINLSAIGAGGMDTVIIPASGYVALYVIFNPATDAKASGCQRHRVDGSLS